jgi:PEP-CTERM motif/Low-density lipoprotein receptor repeat class B
MIAILGYLAFSRKPSMLHRRIASCRLGIATLWITIVVSLVAMAPPSQGASIYWTTSDSIQRANDDGTGVTTLVSGLAQVSPHGIALNPAAGTMYWSTGPSGTIDRANLDGTGVTTLVSGLGIPYGVSVDAAGKIYWSDENQGGIHVANADGSNVTTLVSLVGSGGGTAGLGIDSAVGKIFWGTLGGVLGNANLDGTGVSLNFGTGLGAITGIAVDSTAGKLYLASGSEIVQSNLDGTGMTTVVSNLDNTVGGIAVDSVAGKIYWTQTADGLIESANLDGTGVTTVLSGLNDPFGITLLPGVSVPEPSSLVMGFISTALVGGAVALRRRRSWRRLWGPEQV